ncbi:MAG: cyclic nucleotide-binding domain-containing protein [Deltaproteobacteria bacterium]|nr:cyclic nucleotide-binding domain-containing protein [Deltaproteobacteria bacterium]
MEVTPAALRTLPLFANITEAHLTTLLALFARVTSPAGAVLFSVGDVPEDFLVLTHGEVELLEGSEGRAVLRPLCPVGELGALTGLPRNTTAVTTVESKLLSVRVSALMEFFERHGDIAFPFYHNLLAVVADKVRRDRRRIEEMRGNLMRTQKAMKALRDKVLGSEESPLSAPLFELLEDLIEHNRRGHYRLLPVRPLPAVLRLDDGQTREVCELSESVLRVTGDLPGVDAEGRFGAVLVLPTGELALSGRVTLTAPDFVEFELDPLIEPYRAALEDHVTRTRLLDLVL